MTTLTAKSPVGRWAAERPDTIPVFERHGIDYCCGGGQTLEEACRRAGMDEREALDELSRKPRSPDRANWSRVSLTELCDHIERTHHAFLREQLPFLGRLVDKVATAHRRHHPELDDVRLVFAELCNELEPHMMKEERVLFPAIRALEASPQPPAFPFGRLQNPVHMMEHEHDHAGSALARLRELTGDYTPPDDACTSYQALLKGLAQLEADLHVHIHKENNLLFPRAVELERSRRGAKA